MTTPSTRTLAAALDEVRSAAVAAGLEPEVAVREGEALAAATRGPIASVPRSGMAAKA